MVACKSPKAGLGDVMLGASATVSARICGLAAQVKPKKSWSSLAFSTQRHSGELKVAEYNGASKAAHIKALTLEPARGWALLRYPPVPETKGALGLATAWEDKLVEIAYLNETIVRSTQHGEVSGKRYCMPLLASSDIGQGIRRLRWVPLTEAGTALAASYGGLGARSRSVLERVFMAKSILTPLLPQVLEGE